MGIRNLNKFLRDMCPNVFEEIHISDYAFRKVAIDISLYANVFKASSSDRWLGQFLRMIECLRKNNVHCVFIYDTSSPPEKSEERKRRSDRKKNHANRIIAIEDALDTYYKTGEVDGKLLDFQKKRGLEKKSFLIPNKIPIVNESGIEFELDRMKKSIFHVTRNDFKITKNLFDILNVPYYQAPMEAETTCSDLCKQGSVDAVLSRDSDVIAYGTPIFLTQIESGSGYCKQIRYQDVLTSLDLTSDQFLDFCIMCGTDYNSNIPKIGPKNAYKYIKRFGCIEAIQQALKIDVSILNHIRTRELFIDYEKVDFKIPHCGKPDFEKLVEFAFINNLQISEKRLKDSFCTTNIILVEEENDEENNV